MFDINVIELDNVFGLLSLDDHNTPGRHAMDEKKARAKKRTVVTTDTLFEIKAWEAFMASKDFIDVRYVIEADGKVYSAVGSKHGSDHEITAEVRRMMEDI